MVSIVPPISPIDYTPIVPEEQEPTYESGSDVPVSKGTLTPRIPFAPPIDSDGYVPINLITPYRDPPNTFRASSVEDMFRIIPNVNIYWNDLELEGDTLIASFKFDIGVPSLIRSVIVSCQNRTVSNKLQFDLDLPLYLRSDLGNTFVVPARGDTTTPPVALQPPITTGTGSISTYDPDRFTEETLNKISLLEKRRITNGQPVPTTGWNGSGKGLINIHLFFSDTQANQTMPGRITDEIVFRITPLNVDGPVFVDVNAPVPRDLNKELERDPDRRVPRDDDKTDDPDQPEQPTTVIEYVDREVEVPVPDDTLRWVNGKTGEVEEGYPPDGWYAGSDGRMYPPLITDPCSSESGAFPKAGIDPEDMTELQEMMLKSLNMVVPTFGIQSTKRQGYFISVDSYFDGVDSSRMIKWIPQLAITDSVEDENKFKIIAISDTARDGSPWSQMPGYSSQAEFVQWIADIANAVSYLKEGLNPPQFAITPFQNSRSYNIAVWAKEFLNGKVERVGTELRPTADRLIVNGGAMAAQILEGIEANGEGEFWTEVIKVYIDQLEPYPSVSDAIREAGILNE